MSSPGQLEWIRVEGFKSIRELNLEMKPLTVLVGANGSGKSNFIEVFRLLNEVLASNLQVHSGGAGADRLLHYGGKVTERIEVELSFYAWEADLFNGYMFSLVPSADDTLIFEEESIWLHDRSRYPAPKVNRLGRGHAETHLFDDSAQSVFPRMSDHIIDALQSWKIYHFHDTTPSAKVKKTGDLHDNERLRPDAANLAAFLYLLQEKHPAHYRKIVRTVRRVAPFFEDFVLRPSPLNPDHIRLEWKEHGADLYFDANTLSDGMLRFICLATLLLQPERPSLVLIDEPELGLHPAAIAILADLMRSAAQKVQLIVSTQSVPLVNQFTPADVIVVDRKGGQSQFTRLDEAALADWLDQYYGLGDLWEKNVIGGRPQHPEAPAT